MTDSNIRKVILMSDTESLGLHEDSVMREVHLLAVDAEDPETILKDRTFFLPLLPQQALGRIVYVDTVAWLLGGATERQIESIKENLNGDLEELSSQLRGFTRLFQEVTANREYTLWFRRPQHDVPMLNHLHRQLGMVTPWKYDKICDVATVMDEVGLSYKDVPADPQWGDKHSSKADCHHQLDCLKEARRLQGARHGRQSTGATMDDRGIWTPGTQVQKTPSSFDVGHAKLPGV